MSQITQAPDYESELAGVQPSAQMELQQMAQPNNQACKLQAECS